MYEWNWMQRGAEGNNSAKRTEPKANEWNIKSIVSRVLCACVLWCSMWRKLKRYFQWKLFVLALRQYALISLCIVDFSSVSVGLRLSSFVALIVMSMDFLLNDYETHSQPYQPWENGYNRVLDIRSNLSIKIDVHRYFIGLKACPIHVCYCEWMSIPLRSNLPNPFSQIWMQAKSIIHWPKLSSLYSNSLLHTVSQATKCKKTISSIPKFRNRIDGLLNCEK